MALCSVVLLPTARETIDWRAVPRPRWQDALLVLCGLTFILSSLNLVTIGNRRPVSVLIDDAHGHWEPMDTVMDKEHFGRMATYTYTNMVDILSHYGSVKVSKIPITKELLEDVSVLILKTPSIRYSADEIACITEFVHRGGGLLALGDHTNLIGMSTYLNEVLNPFGLSFEYDDLFFGATGSFSAWERRVSDINPMCATMPSRMRFETSCSIKASLNAQDLLLTRSAVSESLDWANPGFFGNLRYDLHDKLGCFSVASMIDASGKGRVIAFGDSTIFSNFSLYFQGRRELLLTWIDLLSRSDGYGNIMRIGMFLLGLVLCFTRIRSARLGNYLFLVIGLAVALSVVSIKTYYGVALSGFVPERPLHEVVFVAPSQDELMNWGTSMGEWLGDFDHEYSTFFVCAQRIGMHPKWTTKPEYSPDVRGLVLLDWDLLSQPSTASALGQYAAAGTPILLLRDRNTDSPKLDIVLDNLLGPDRQLVHADDPSMSVRIDGPSRIVVSDHLDTLTRTSMGKVDAIPTQEQMKCYTTAFKLLEAIKLD